MRQKVAGVNPEKSVVYEAMLKRKHDPDLAARSAAGLPMWTQYDEEALQEIERLLNKIDGACAEAYRNCKY